MIRKDKVVLATLLALSLGSFGFLAFRAIQAARYMAAETGRSVPGEAEFRGANRQIHVLKGGGALGNSPEAVQLATVFASVQKTLRETMFTGGRRGVLSATQGEFLTYCQCAPRSCVFLVHVPELRQYSQDAKDALHELAWRAAQAAVREKWPETDMDLAVALRGAALYESIAVGRSEGEPTLYADAMRELSRLYPFFSVQATSAMARSRPPSAHPRSGPDPSDVLPAKWTSRRGGLLTEVTFRHDGTFEGFSMQEGAKVLEFLGHWTASRDELVWRYQKSTPPLPDHLRVDRNAILRLTGTTLLVRERDGSETLFEKAHSP